jgi:alpha/beta superfamily hydrolase
LRFNYRGVGKSEGEYDNGCGEVEDAIAVIDWVRLRYPDCRLILAGFSFGAYISYCVAANSKYVNHIQQLLSITMPQYPELIKLPQPNCSWLLIQGLADEIVDPQAVFNWVASLINPPCLIKMPDTSHFFHGRLLELRDIISKYIL